MGKDVISRIFSRLDEIQSDLSEIKGMCGEREKRICNLESCEFRGSGDKKWLQWLVGALIGIIGSLVGSAVN